MNPHAFRGLVIVASGLAVFCLGIMPIAGSPPERQDPAGAEERKKAPPRPRRFTNEDLKHVRGNISTSAPTPAPEPAVPASEAKPGTSPVLTGFPDTSEIDRAAEISSKALDELRALYNQQHHLEYRIGSLQTLKKQKNVAIAHAMQRQLTHNERNSSEISRIQQERDSIRTELARFQSELDQINAKLQSAFNTAQDLNISREAIQSIETTTLETPR